MKKFHWSQRYGRSGKYLGALWFKLLDDHQKLYGQVTVVAQGHRAQVQIHDGNFHDRYIAGSVEDGRNNVEMYFAS